MLYIQSTLLFSDLGDTNQNEQTVESLKQDLIKAKGLRKRGHIVADTLLPTQMFPRLHARNICRGHKLCVREGKDVFDFVEKHFVFTTNVS